ncbi:MAG: hypothetical protein FJX71_02080 [Alphaproteobacteria bacterium]|nr:hypothetical protein [Alphaproteobacteria bacterium]
MTIAKHLKLSSTLLLGTLVAGVLVFPKAANGAEDVKRHLEALHAQQLATVRAGHGADLAAITKLKDAMAHPNQALATPGAPGSLGAAIVAAAADPACVIGGAVAAPAAVGPAPAPVPMPIATEADKIAAIRALEAAGAHGATNPQHRSAIRTALGLDPAPANFAATQAELNHFLAAAEQRLVHLPERTQRAAALTAYIDRLRTARAQLAAGGHFATLAANLKGLGGIAAAMPDGNEDQRLAVINAVEAAPPDGGLNDNGKDLIRTALNLPAGPGANHDKVEVFLRAARF